MYLRELRREDLPAVLALSIQLFPQIDPRRAGLERVFDNPDALALAAITGREDDGGGGEIAGFVVTIVGDAEPMGARDGGSTAAHDYEQIRRLVLLEAAAAQGAAEGGVGGGGGGGGAAPPPSPLMAVSVRSARAGGPVRVGCVALLGVSPAHRRKGLARRLMRSAAAFASGLGAAALYLHTPAGNAAAVSLYERRLGFLRAAFLPGYYARSREGGGGDGAGGGGGEAAAAVEVEGGTDAFLFVRPLFGGAVRSAAAAPAEAPRAAASAPPPAAGGSLPQLLPLPLWARRPARGDDLAQAPGPSAVSFRVDDETGEVALVDEDEEEEDKDEEEGGRGAGRALAPPQRLLQRLLLGASALPLASPRRSAGRPLPPARAIAAAGRRSGGQSAEERRLAVTTTTPPPRRRAPVPLRPLLRRPATRALLSAGAAALLR